MAILQKSSNKVTDRRPQCNEDCATATRESVFQGRPIIARRLYRTMGLLSVKGWTVKKLVLFVGLLLLIVGGTGCVVIDAEKVQSCGPAAEVVEVRIPPGLALPEGPEMLGSSGMAS